MSHKTRVAYYYDSEIGNYHYGQGHPMKVRQRAPKTQSLHTRNLASYLLSPIACGWHTI